MFVQGMGKFRCEVPGKISDLPSKLDVIEGERSVPGGQTAEPFKQETSGDSAADRPRPRSSGVTADPRPDLVRQQRGVVESRAASVVDRGPVVGEVFGDADEGGANARPMIVVLKELQNTRDVTALDGGVNQACGLVECESAVDKQQRDRQCLTQMAMAAVRDGQSKRETGHNFDGRRLASRLGRSALDMGWPGSAEPMRYLS